MCNCPNCQIGMPCRSNFHCGDPGCDICPQAIVSPGSVIDMKAALRIIAEKAEREKAEKEEKYRKHIEGLEKLNGAVRMFRTWRLFPDGSLKAMTQDHTWQPGENVTLASGGDASRDSGFYGFNSLAELREQEEDWWEASQSGEPEYRPTYDQWGYRRGYSKEPLYWYVCGTILCYGHVKVSARGGRVQKAIPEYIIWPDDADLDFGLLVTNAAEKYGMKIVSVADAEDIRTGLVPYVKGESPE